jgi:capsular exopolysaccharide synthesis family protein
VDDPTRTLMVTSPGPTEGKSITLANLAVVLAQSGRKVVVVDTDLRRPVLHRAFDVAKSHGLSDVILTSNPGLEEHLQATAMDNLWVLPSGSLPPNPAELLGSERFKGLIEELKERADVILFDSPPVLAVTDAAVLSTRVDGVLLINEAGRTRRQEARQAVEELQRVGANLLGVVLNRLSRRNGGYYYYYYYYRSDDGTRKRRRRPSLLERLIPFLGRDTGEVEE